MSNDIANTPAAEIACPVPTGSGATMVSLQEWRPPRDALQPLSNLDWRVIELARADGPRSLNPVGIAARFARLLGISVPRPLANDAIEALRRFSVRAWYWDQIRARDLRALYGAGYSTTHLLQILAHVTSVRGFTPTLQEDPARFTSAKSMRGRSSPCRCG